MSIILYGYAFFIIIVMYFSLLFPASTLLMYLLMHACCVVLIDIIACAEAPEEIKVDIGCCMPEYKCIKL